MSFCQVRRQPWAANRRMLLRAVSVMRSAFTKAVLLITAFLSGSSTYANLAASVLPGSRSVEVGTTATAFASIINVGGSTATGCSIAPAIAVAAEFNYQRTDPATNASIGSPNELFDIPAGGLQSTFFSFTPTDAFAPIDIPLTFECANTEPAASNRLNTFTLGASSSPVVDMIALAATPTADGISNVDLDSTFGVFAVATVNLGSTDTIRVSADTGAASLPVNMLVCQTDPISGACIDGTLPSGEVVTSVATNETPTFAFFAQATAPVPFDALNNRVFVNFRDSLGVVRGSSSVALRDGPFNTDAVFINTGEPAMPLLYVDGSDRVAGFVADEVSGEINGLALLAPSGVPLSLRFDTITELPTEIGTPSARVFFSNIRDSEQRMDVGFLDSQGEVTRLVDFDYSFFGPMTAQQRGRVAFGEPERSLSPPYLMGSASSVTPQTAGDAVQALRVADALACIMPTLLRQAPTPIKNALTEALGNGGMSCVGFASFVFSNAARGSTRTITLDRLQSLLPLADAAVLAATINTAGQSCAAAGAASVAGPLAAGLWALCISSVLGAAEGAYNLSRTAWAAGVALASDRADGFPLVCCDGPTQLSRLDLAVFTVHVSTDAAFGSPPYEVFVDFGNGDTESQQSTGGRVQFANSYDAVGSYNIVATVTNAAGQSAQAPAKRVVVEPPRTLITVDCCAPDPMPLRPLEERTWPVTITGGVEPYLVEVDWGDPAIDDELHITGTGDIELSQAFATPGERTVRILVRDGAGVGVPLTTEVVFNVEVADVLSLDCCAPGPPIVQRSVSNTWFPRIIGGAGPYEMSIDWGDGTSTVIETDEAGALETTHVYNNNGTFQISTSVTDSNNEVAEGELFAVTVAEELRGFTGVFTTSFGTMTFNGARKGAVAQYDQEDGVLHASAMTDTVLVGFWAEPASRQVCDVARFGTVHWGRLIFEMNADDQGFSGTWEFCENDPRRTWTGSRVVPSG